MKPTLFFHRKSDMTAFAKAFAKSQPLNWFVRTTMHCNHRVTEKRKAIFLIQNETIVQRLVQCNTCKQMQKEIEPKNQVV